MLPILARQSSIFKIFRVNSETYFLLPRINKLVAKNKWSWNKHDQGFKDILASTPQWQETFTLTMLMAQRAIAYICVHHVFGIFFVFQYSSFCTLNSFMTMIHKFVNQNWVSFISLHYIPYIESKEIFYSKWRAHSSEFPLLLEEII